MDSPRVWELAAERYAQYVRNRKRSGGSEPRRILADFLIRAQVLAQPGLGYTPAIATFDPGVYSRYFLGAQALRSAVVAWGLSAQSHHIIHTKPQT